MYPAAPINVAQFSIEKDFSTAVSAELMERIKEHEDRMAHLQEWKSTDADLIQQYSKNMSDFRTHCNVFIKWHMKVINAKPDEQPAFRTQFELALGINTEQRVLDQQASQ